MFDEDLSGQEVSLIIMRYRNLVFEQLRWDFVFCWQCLQVVFFNFSAWVRGKTCHQHSSLNFCGSNLYSYISLTRIGKDSFAVDVNFSNLECYFGNCFFFIEA